MALPIYATTGQRVWYYTFRVICGLIFFFLIAPILIIIPLYVLYSRLKLLDNLFTLALVDAAFALPSKFARSRP